MAFDLAHSESELEALADSLSSEIKGAKEPIVSRYTLVAKDAVVFRNGHRQAEHSAAGTVNLERMASQLYCQTGHASLPAGELPELSVERDLNHSRFTFPVKGNPLPEDRFVSHEQGQLDFTRYDDELMNFSQTHPGASIRREFRIEQRIVLNSRGGLAMQSIPFFGISYLHGHEPVPTARDIYVVARNDADLERLPAMVKYLADPTPDRRIKNAQGFTAAFHELFKISTLKFGSLEEAGIPLSGLYDVVMLTGVPIHEIFGHHFEEPVKHLRSGESGTFKNGQLIGDKNLVLTDDPRKMVDGFNLLGYTHVDAYGRKREARTHIKNGAVTGFLGSEYADQENLKQFLHLDGSPFTGGALQYTDGAFPQNRMTCTVLDGKSEPFDLEGKLCIVSHSGYTNPSDKTYLVYGFECYVVRDGQPLRIGPVRVSGGINQALSNLVLLDDWSYQTGMCGKPDPIVGQYTARVPVSQFTRSQVWRGQQVYPTPIRENHLKILQD